ncbi:hypothetical protein HZH66_004730 [Vespula vulgaris]|uniref:Uncharacterized protein n=1 Tax=Vespula vulgaris TaxID=7454 RepID=A0A834K9D0_VESVU|nr:hypothetical protein HZH66_004730 [Vespula vulgaris]
MEVTKRVGIEKRQGWEGITIESFPFPLLDTHHGILKSGEVHCLASYSIGVGIADSTGPVAEVVFVSTHNFCDKYLLHVY